MSLLRNIPYNVANLVKVIYDEVGAEIPGVGTYKSESMLLHIASDTLWIYEMNLSEFKILVPSNDEKIVSWSNNVMK
jgi:hypothetical protein